MRKIAQIVVAFSEKLNFIRKNILKSLNWLKVLSEEKSNCKFLKYIDDQNSVVLFKQKTYKNLASTVDSKE